MARTGLEKHDVLTSLLEKKRKKQRAIQRQQAKVRSIDRKIEALINSEER